MRVTFVNRTAFRFPSDVIRRAVRESIRVLAARGLWRHDPYGVNVVFVSPTESASWNRRYRRRPKPADVLSFDYGTIGEVLVAPAVARREAAAFRRSFGASLVALVVHGVVHLAGVHHEHSLRRAALSKRIEAFIVERIVRRGATHRVVRRHA